MRDHQTFSNEEYNYILEYLERDPNLNIFFLSNLAYKPRHVKFFVLNCGEYNCFGYIATKPSLFGEIRGDSKQCSRLIEYIKEIKGDKYVVITEEMKQYLAPYLILNNLSIIEVMYLDREEFNYQKSSPQNNCRMLSLDDIPMLAYIYGVDKKLAFTIYHNLSPLCGYYLDGSLVAVAGTLARYKKVWMLGGVYTSPKHRGKGYCRDTLSVWLEQAFKDADKVIVWVKEDNIPAKRLYKSLGFKKYRKKLYMIHLRSHNSIFLAKFLKNLFYLP